MNRLLTRLFGPRYTCPACGHTSRGDAASTRHGASCRWGTL